jgi:hypothetical protein
MGMDASESAYLWRLCPKPPLEAPVAISRKCAERCHRRFEHLWRCVRPLALKSPRLVRRQLNGGATVESIGIAEGIST